MNNIKHCAYCDGVGNIFGEKCWMCEGSGLDTLEKDLNKRMKEKIGLMIPVLYNPKFSKEFIEWIFLNCTSHWEGKTVKTLVTGPREDDMSEMETYMAEVHNSNSLFSIQTLMEKIGDAGYRVPPEDEGIFQYIIRRDFTGYIELEDPI